MTDEQTPKSGNGNGSTSGEDNTRAFLLQQLYVKDLSFEAPNSPKIFQESALEPETELNIRNSHSSVGENLYEVVLHISVHAKKGDQTIFLVELDQAGLFILKGYSAEECSTLLGTQCPGTLFPYAREAVSATVGKGGFPPLMLQPINFDLLYARAREKSETQD
ncbi:MAG: protein-export chaperone SecB [Gammaproteobacteria bacterium]|jgi:preprotein translocase subunit SecB|nr:protein-export chaperone SecB [Gammaproteobacteria bacterium]MDP6616863.1 protein-export chaperone SecB [Gammaproteobacteria bacterium]MDP6694577.1 protein-export chaperone SecB [Gammaproteobacteria bacterium]